MASQRDEDSSTSSALNLPQNENYMLGRVSGGTQENRRLETQHDAIRHGIMNGRLVHQTIPMASLQGCVADVCCGTGVWLNDLAEELMAAGHWGQSKTPVPAFVGFDLTAAAFRENLAPNVRLVEHDCCQPFASEYVGKFDLVNMRGLAYAIPESSFGTLFLNACSLLKPGGFMQWLDTESQLWTSAPEAEELARALNLIMRERSERRLVDYMPDFMIRQYLSVNQPDLSPTTVLSGAGELSLVHFSLTPGGASRPWAIHDTDLNKHFSDIVMETIKLLLEGSMLREEHALVEMGTARENNDILTTKRCLQYVVDAQARETIIVSGQFPLLIARKSVPVTTTDVNVV